MAVDQEVHIAESGVAAMEAPSNEIEKNGIVSDVRVYFECLLTRLRHIHRVGILTQGTRDKVGDLPFVFDQENPHRLCLISSHNGGRSCSCKKMVNFIRR